MEIEQIIFKFEDDRKFIIAMREYGPSMIELFIEVKRNYDYLQFADLYNAGFKTNDFNLNQFINGFHVFMVHEHPYKDKADLIKSNLILMINSTKVHNELSISISFKDEIELYKDRVFIKLKENTECLNIAEFVQLAYLTCDSEYDEEDNIKNTYLYEKEGYFVRLQKVNEGDDLSGVDINIERYE